MIDALLMAALLLAAVLLGLRAPRRTGGVPAVLVFLSLVASFLGGGFSFGLAARSFGLGWPPVVALWGFSLGTVLVGWFVAPRLARFRDCATVGEVLGRAYGSAARTAAGVLAAFFCCAVLGAQLRSLALALGAWLGLGVPLAVAVSAALLWSLTATGGIRGLLAVAPLQCALLVVAYAMMLVLGVGRAGGLAHVLSAAPAFDAAPAALAGSFALFFCGETLAPPYVRSLLLAKDGGAGRKGVVSAGAVSAVLFVVSGLAGITARVLLPAIPAESALPALLSAALPAGLRGIGAAGVLSGLAACGSAYLCAAVDHFRGDVLRAEGRYTLGTDRSRLWLTALLAAGAAVVALLAGDVLGALALAYSLWAPAVTVPLIAAAFLNRPPKGLFFFCGGAGVVAMAAWELCGNPMNIPGAVFGIMISVAVCPAIVARARRAARPRRSVEVV